MRRATRHESDESASFGSRYEVPVVATPSDGELVERIRTGDSWAKEALYRKYFGGIWAVVLRLLGNRADAEDVVQDTFAIALTEFESLRRPEAVGAWLMQIAVRQTHRRFRRRKLRRLLGLDRSIDDASLELLAHEGTSPEVRAELEKVDRVLARLAPAQRIAWMLRYVEGGSLEEVAAACSCSLATVKRRIVAAEDEVRKHVKMEEA
ncbi:RNA polymerase sigma factor [Pendulispora rubella]|uniref:RNA polymerase sigma factor n=1 Tax=Pendulispora rubella TaxID=2741070 RepID=A0ABZ2L599_9BACT